MSGTCPKCGSTDIGDTVDGRCTCLDCNMIWMPKARREKRRVDEG